MGAAPGRTGVMYVAEYRKPDGRMLWLYGRRPLAPLPRDAIPSPSPTPVEINSHMRWHPLLREWVVYAAHRQDRTFLPPADHNPLAPTRDPLRPTELPPGDYDVAVFENRFPALAPQPGIPPAVPDAEVAPAVGSCEVVVFAQEPDVSLGGLPQDRIALILDVWAARTEDMARRKIAYVLPFENRGVEMGVTLHHPHGQIYGYGFIPSRQARVMAALQAHHRRSGRDLVTTLAETERGLGLRVIAAHGTAIGFCPPFARFPYESWVVPQRPAQRLSALSGTERDDLAATLKETLMRLDGLWTRPMPYLLTVNQAPTDGADHPEWSLRIEIWPIRRDPNKLKYLAGTELGTGVFASDVTPEAAAEALRKVRL